MSGRIHFWLVASSECSRICGSDSQWQIYLCNIITLVYILKGLSIGPSILYSQEHTSQWYIITWSLAYLLSQCTNHLEHITIFQHPVVLKYNFSLLPSIKQRYQYNPHGAHPLVLIYVFLYLFRQTQQSITSYYIIIIYEPKQPSTHVM